MALRNILFTVLCFAITDFISAALPEYVKVCKRDQNTVNACVQNSIEELRPYLVKGIPELNVPSIDPLTVDEVKLDMFGGYVKNVQLYGLSKIEFKKIQVDLESNIIKAAVAAPVVWLNGHGSVNAKILSIPINGQGPVAANLTDCELDVVIKFKVTENDGQEFLEFTNCDVDLRVGDYDVSIDSLFEGNPALGETAKKVIHQSKQDLWAMVVPLLKEVISRVMLEIGNKIVETESYGNILPVP